jgi:hypothetical protein
LFLLRDVNQEDLIAGADAGLRPPATGRASGKVIESGDLSQIFGIEMADGVEAGTLRRPRAARKSAAAPADRVPDAQPVTAPRATAPRAERKREKDGPGAMKKPVARAAPKATTRKRFSARQRAAVVERMKKYWAERLKNRKAR